VGFSILFVGGAVIMAQWFRPREFAFLTGVWTSVANIGSVVATAPLAMLIALVGWRLCFDFIGIAVLALAMLVFIFVRNRPSDLQLFPRHSAAADRLQPASAKVATRAAGSNGSRRNHHSWRMDEISPSADIIGAQAIRMPQQSFGVQLLDAAKDKNMAPWLVGWVFLWFALLDFVSGITRPLITWSVFGCYAAYRYAWFLLGRLRPGAAANGAELLVG
jgi:hypothetical protein